MADIGTIAAVAATAASIAFPTFPPTGAGYQQYARWLETQTGVRRSELIAIGDELAFALLPDRPRRLRVETLSPGAWRAIGGRSGLASVALDCSARTATATLVEVRQGSGLLGAPVTPDGLPLTISAQTSARLAVALCDPQLSSSRMWTGAAAPGDAAAASPSAAVPPTPAVVLQGAPAPEAPAAPPPPSMVAPPASITTQTAPLVLAPAAPTPAIEPAPVVRSTPLARLPATVVQPVASAAQAEPSPAPAELTAPAALLRPDATPPAPTPLGSASADLGDFPSAVEAMLALRELATAAPNLMSGRLHGFDRIDVGREPPYRALVTGFGDVTAATDFCRAVEALNRACRARASAN